MNYLLIAKATTIETQNHLILARDLAYLTETQFNQLFQKCEEVLHQLGGWIKRIDS